MQQIIVAPSLGENIADRAAARPVFFPTDLELRYYHSQWALAKSHLWNTTK